MIRDDETVSTQPIRTVPAPPAHAEQVVSTSPVSSATVTAERLESVPTVPVVAAAPVAHEVRRTTVRRAIALDSIVAGAAGVVILVVGLLAVVRAGLDGPMDQPVVEVAGFTHTATLGAIEVVLGLALLIAAASRSRAACAFWGVVLGIAGFVGGVQSESFTDSLAIESSMAWWLMATGIVVFAAAALLPRRTHTASTVDAI